MLILLSACSVAQPAQKTPLALETQLVSTQTALPAASPASFPGSPSQTPSLAFDPPAHECTDTSGSVEAFQIDRAGVELTGQIYTPPCYEEDPDLRYPTLYLLHGATETDRQWLDLGVAEAADKLISESAISPLIIIMPRELTWVALPRNPFGDALVTELLPWIESRYRTLEDRDFRALGGLSRGGNWAVRIGLLHWGMFGSIGAHSTPLFYGDLERLAGWIEVIPPSRYPRIYLDIGKDDNNLGAAQNLDKALTGLEVPHEWIINPGLHDEVYWSAHLEDYLLWYSEAWGIIK